MTDDGDIVDYITQHLSTTMAAAGVDDNVATQIIEQLEMDTRNEYGSEQLYIRSAQRASRRERDNGILMLWREGIERAKIAKHFNIDRSTVTRVINRHLKNIQQQSGLNNYK